MMAKSLMDQIFDSIFDADWVGKYGEKLTERKLNIVRLFGRKGKVLRNVYVPTDNGETSEIDVLFITQKGVFVFESKNYSGWIFGDEKSQYWTVMLSNKTKNRFYNPIRQNRTHIKWLGNYLGNQVPLFSIIVFSERCELKKITVDNPETKVIKRDRTYAVVREIWNTAPDALIEEEVDEIYERLKKLTNVDDAVKQAHVQSIEQKYKHKENAKEARSDATESEPTQAIISSAAELKTVLPENPEPVQEASSSKVPADATRPVVQQTATGDGQQSPAPVSDKMICPKCGSPLVLRVAKKGAYAGNRFYGCSGYPKCRYMQNTDEPSK